MKSIFPELDLDILMIFHIFYTVDNCQRTTSRKGYILMVIRRGI